MSLVIKNILTAGRSGAPYIPLRSISGKSVRLSAPAAPSLKKTLRKPHRGIATLPAAHIFF